MSAQKLIKNKKFWLYSSLGYLFVAIFFVFIFDSNDIFNISADGQIVSNYISKKLIPPLNKEEYDARLNILAHLATTTTSTSSLSTSTKVSLWPVKTVYPNAGAILPFKRIIAYYGNYYSKDMGVLGQYPEDEMLSMLLSEVSKWNIADQNTPAIPALQYIAVTAQGHAGVDGKYRARMPFTQIDKTIELASKVNGLVFLDIQVGQSTLQDEVPLLEKYLKMPQVHLAIDPEFAMKAGQVPGAKFVGTFDALDINYVIDYLAHIVQKNNLPPKILIIHRYRKNMVTNADRIETLPEVQILMNMDGWGTASGKTAIYRQYIYNEPVQFAGIKLFYHNDTIGSSTLMTTDQVLKLTPTPIYIQYQ